MKRLLRLAVPALLAWLLPATAQAAASPCSATRGERLAPPSARVDVVRTPRGAFQACDRRTRRRTRLDVPTVVGDPDAYVEQVVVAGRFVAFVRGARSPCSTCGGGAFPRLVDASTGRDRPLGTAGCGGTHVITDLVADARGRVAWICFRSGNVDLAGGQQAEVRAVDRDGPRLLDTEADGTGIRFESLELAAGLLRWEAPDGPRSAALA